GGLSVVSLAALARRRTALEAASAPPGNADARCRAGSLDLSRCLAGCLVGGPGGPAAGPTHVAHAGGRARRADAAAAGSPQHPRRDGPRGVVPAPFRGDEPGRDRSFAGNRRIGRCQTLYPRPQATQGDPCQHAGRTRQCLTTTRKVPPTTSCSPGSPTSSPSATGVASAPP